MATCTTWRLLRLSPPPIVWQNMIRSVIRISLPQEKKEIPRITPTAPTFRWITRQIFLMLWIFRTSCRLCTPPALSSMHFWEKSCLTGRRLPAWCGRLRKITSCPITPCHPPIPFVRSMAISAASILNVPSADRRQRSTAVSPATIVRCRTGTTARPRNTRTGGFMMLKNPA